MEYGSFDRFDYVVVGGGSAGCVAAAKLADDPSNRVLLLEVGPPAEENPETLAAYAEWGEVFGDPVVATALLDRLLHHAVVVQIEGASYRLRGHADLIPEHVRANAPISPPPPPKRRGRPPGSKNGSATMSSKRGMPMARRM